LIRTSSRFATGGADDVRNSVERHIVEVGHTWMHFGGGAAAKGEGREGGSISEGVASSSFRPFSED